MRSLSQALTLEKNALFTPNAWLVLLDIKLQGAPDYHFCSGNENIAFQGRNYTAFPFMLDPAKESSSGEIPSIELKLTNVTRIVHAWLEDLDGAVGSTVLVRVVNSAFLEENYADLEMEFTVLGTTADAEWIVFTLGAPNPLRRRYPPYRFIAGHCNWAGHFKGVECRYSGPETACNGTWKMCVSLSNTRNFGGHRGLSEQGWRVV